MSKAGTMRLQKEYKVLAKEFEKIIEESKDGLITTDNFLASPETDNVFIWHFIVFNLADQYKGGFYMGKLIFPNDYPWKPPSIMMTTETGRF